MFRNRGDSYLIKIFAWGYKVEKFLLAVGTLLYYGVTIWGKINAHYIRIQRFY